MRLSAADCLRRGLANLRANWELVAVNWAGTVLWVTLAALGFVPPLLVLGFDLSRMESWGRPEQAAAALEDLLRGFSFSPALGLALLAAGALWLLSALVFCSVQAGSFGVLIAGERQALPGAPRDSRWFRTFSLRDFLGWGGRYLWRFFGFVHLAVALLALVLLLVAAWLLFLAVGATRWGAGAAFGIGCGGALPILFLVVLLTVWFYVAQSDLAREGSGVGRASRRALQVIGRRLGAVILLFVLWLIAVLGLWAAFWPLSRSMDLALGDQPAVQGAAGLALTLIERLPQALLNLALASAFVALVRSETARSEAGA